jgi:1,6-anhydro-N-acetylmuramate kinase
MESSPVFQKVRVVKQYLKQYLTFIRDRITSITWDAGEQLRQAVRRGDAAKVSTLLSTQGAQSFINYQDEHGRTLLHDATIRGHETVTEQLIVAC